VKSAKGMKVIAEFSIHPVGEGTSLSGFVKTAVAELRARKGLRVSVTPMGSVIEADRLSDVLSAVEACNERLFREGAKRVILTLRVDDRRDKRRAMEDKVAAVG